MVQRYTGIKGKYWALLSVAIRERDFNRFGTCISCSRKIECENGRIIGDAGHYAPAQNCGSTLKFDPKNIHLECKGCNGFDKGHLIGYRSNLVRRYGEKFAEELDARYKKAKFSATPEWRQYEWERELERLKVDPQGYVAL